MVQTTCSLCHARTTVVNPELLEHPYAFVACFNCAPPAPIPRARVRPRWLRALWEWLW